MFCCVVSYRCCFNCVWYVVKSCVEVAVFKASLYSSAAVSNVCLSQNGVLIRLLIEWRSSRRIGVGWLEERLM